MFQDLAFGLKLLWKNKAFTLAALVTLALCIGANTSIFTVLDGVLLRGLPFPEPDRLVTMYNLYPGVGVTDHGSNSVPNYLDRRKLTGVFSEVALIGDDGYDVGLANTPQRIHGLYVTPSYFRILAVQPILGRIFTEEEATQGKDNVAILSEGLWKDMFGRDRNVLGRDIRLSGVPHRIIGVLPERFASLGGEPPRIWLPFAFTPDQTSDDARHNNNWGMIARLRPGVTVARAQERINALNRQDLDRFPQYKALLISAKFQTRVIGLQDELVRDVRPILYLLQAAVAFVLLIGCVNLANLMLVRSNVRMKELAIRFSLGAGRWRIARQLLTESLTLAVLGGALGIAVGIGGVKLLVTLAADNLPRAGDIHIDGGVLAFTAAMAVFTGLVFGSVPLIHVMRSNLNEIFRGNERSGTMGRHAMWVRSALVVCQVSLAFVLLIGSGLLTLSFARLLTVRPGFQSENVITAQFSLPEARYKDDPAVRNFVSSLLEKLRATPGVTHAGATTYLPFSGNNNASVISIDSYPLAPGENPPVPGWNTVDSGYIPTMNIPILEGRNFTEGDGPDSQKVALIDQFLAHKYWPNGGAIGNTLRRGIDDGDKNAKKEPHFTIVGVVGSVKTGDLAEQNPVGQVYFFHTQWPHREMHLVVKATRDDPQLISTIRREILQADPELPLFDTKTMPERVSASLVDRRAPMILCLIFGGLALLLSAIGVYGVLAYSVTQRTREFGIRMALGAEMRDVLGMVLWQGLRLAGVGLMIGAAVAFLLTRFIATMLYDVKPADPTVFLLGAAVLGAVAAIASLVPSVRAVRIRPAVALRWE
ncbi:MAG TPA: ABC transporter permease [Bryobacteraceae bacterium]|nr:ABC transporter permease [Bryobacteraceae bacterium]